MTEDCFVCTSGVARTADLPWRDRAIHRLPGVGCTLLGVGAIAPGYLLACPDLHVASLALLPRPARMRFKGLVQLAVRALRRAFGPPLLFEHGACEGEARTSSCVSHAHLHLWSVALNVRLRVPQVTHTYRDLADFLSTHPANREGYLMHAEPDGRISVGPDVGTPQYFRREIARQLGSPDEWDYALFAFEGNMMVTRDALTGRS
jgi:hypothetical protein